MMQLFLAQAKTPSQRFETLGLLMNTQIDRLHPREAR